MSETIEDLIDELKSASQELGSDTPAMGAWERVIVARHNLEEAIHKIEAERDALLKENRRIPVTEQLPGKSDGDLSDIVIAYNEQGQAILAFYDYGYSAWRNAFSAHPRIRGVVSWKSIK